MTGKFRGSYDVHEPSEKKRCWSNSLAIACVFLFILSLVMLTLFLIEACKRYHAKKICLTKDCILTTSTLLSTVDLSKDGCEDFYHLSCDGFISKNAVPEDESMISTLTVYNNNKNMQLRNLIENLNSSKEPNVVFRAAETYQVCLNISYNVKEEISAFRDYVIYVLDGLHLDDSSRNSPVSMEEYLGKMIRLGHGNGLFGLTLEPDLYNNDKYVIHITEPSVGIFKMLHKEPFQKQSDIVNNDEHLRQQTTFMSKAASFFNYKNSISIIKRLHELENFHKEISQLTWESKDLWSKEKMKIIELNELMEQHFNWLEIFNNAFEGIHTFSDQDSVIVTYKENLSSLSKILRNFSSRTLHNFIVLQIMTNIRQSMEYLIDKALDEKIDNSISYSHTSRWKKCLDLAQEIYPMVFNRLFVNKYVDKKSKETIDLMIQFVQDAYKKMIQESEWLDARTKEIAIRKVDAMKRLIGYSDIILNDDELEKSYNYLPTVTSTHLQNIFEMNKNITERNMKLINQPVDHYRWLRNPLDINAFYNPLSNAIAIPSGLLQLPFFSPNRPAVLNFAMIGVIIGHEMGQAFDDLGSHFDEVGRMHQWWEKETYEKFNQRTKCFVDQYSKYCSEIIRSGNTPICLTGNLSLRENVADNTALQAAYEGFKMWIRKYHEDDRLPGIESFDHEGLFFLSYGYRFCQNIRAEKWEKLLSIDDTQIPGHYRVIGSLANFEDFVKLSGCPVGNMNRGKELCTLW